MRPRHSHIAVLAPIADPDFGVGEVTREVREKIENQSWQTLREDYLRFLPMLHMCRFQIIRQLIPGLGEMLPPERLRSRHFLFIAEVDGTDDEFYDALFFQQPNLVTPPWRDWPPQDSPGALVRDIWGNCTGFPANDEAYLFRRFMHRFEIPATVEYAGSRASLPQVLRALLIKDLTGAWMALETNDGPGSMAASIAQYTATVAKIEAFQLQKLIELYLRVFDPDPMAFVDLVNTVDNI